jgi:hypothetical protein
MIEWPARCAYCKTEIEDWTQAGLHDKQWMHKACYTTRWNEAHNAGTELPALRSPAERGSQLEMPMLLFLLLFHFGLGFAVIGWIMIDQEQSSATLGLALLVTGIIVPLIGIAGVALNIISRRRIQLIQQQLDLAGGWKPGR